MPLSNVKPDLYSQQLQSKADKIARPADERADRPQTDHRSKDARLVSLGLGDQITDHQNREDAEIAEFAAHETAAENELAKGSSGSWVRSRSTYSSSCQPSLFRRWMK